MTLPPHPFNLLSKPGQREQCLRTLFSKLTDRDVFSKSDPLCVVYQLEGRLQGRGEYREKGRTERLLNTLNPEWDTKIRLQYYFEERQTLRFDM